MSIVSIPFLFLFFPFSLAVYYLLPAKKSQVPRNVFLLLVSLIFYAWGKPDRLVLLCALIVADWLLGMWVEGKKGTKLGKWIVAIAVLVNAGTLFVYKYVDFLFDNVEAITGLELPSLGFALPLGLSFFCFQAISYVVDIYRGKAKSTRNLLNTALYLSIFFKITQGPIVQYNQFESQLSERKTTFAGFSEGLWRFVLGIGKKTLLASNLGYLVSDVFSADFAALPVASAWLGCLAYMLQIFFDFSGYSDMAIGLGKMFGFELPENFDYPYMAHSVTEYWQRWHISLGSWFRDYMFYPLTLGPAIRMRKRLAKRKVSKNTAKLLQNIFVTGVIWFTTGLWHGASWNYILWGVINGIFIIWELYKKPLKNQKLDIFLGWLYTFFVSFFTKALVHNPDMKSAIGFYGAMLGLNGNPFVSGVTAFYIREYWIYLLVAILACFPLYTKLKERILKPERKALACVFTVVETVALCAVLVFSVAFLFKYGHTEFIYQKF